MPGGGAGSGGCAAGATPGAIGASVATRVGVPGRSAIKIPEALWESSRAGGRAAGELHAEGEIGEPEVPAPGGGAGEGGGAAGATPGAVGASVAARVGASWRSAV